MCYWAKPKDGPGQGPAMQDGRVFRRILVKYKRAWERRDPRLAMELFTPDATYREDPFDERPMRGLGEIRDYWARVPRFWEYWHVRGGKPSFRARTLKNMSG